LAPFYTSLGDSGDTGFLGKGRYSKASPMIEAVGSVDEASAALGFARSVNEIEDIKTIILEIQKQLYVLMTELSSVPDANSHFAKITQDDVHYLEAQIASIEASVDLPREFIIPGESVSSAVLAMARTVIRRAERRTIAFIQENDYQNQNLTAYLNRLSSLVFVLEIYDITKSGRALKLVKEE
jgi:cob(I)alamin adenosyltransferase